MSRLPLIACTALACALLLAACGKKGNLFLPDQQKTTVPPVQLPPSPQPPQNPQAPPADSDKN